MKALVTGALAATLGLGASASAQPTLRIGFITTLSGPQGIIGKHMRDSVELALRNCKMDW